MTTKKAIVILFLGVMAVSCISCRSADNNLSGTWIDLTHEFSDDTVYCPTADPFKLEIVSQGRTDQGYYYSAFKFCAAEHGGTHLDAPIHFSEGRMTADQLPLDKLISAAVKVDVSGPALENRDHQVSIEDFTRWESQHQQIGAGSIVLIETGYSRFWPDRLKYLGTEKRGPEAVPELHFPGLHPEAAKWLAQIRKVKAVGIDTASIDYGQSTLFESHQALAANDTPIFENVADLARVPATGATVIALPMKIQGGSGGPLRIIALAPPRN